MIRSARCSCGNLQIELNGDPEFVIACNCLKCQKRTGSVFGVSAYFNNNKIIHKKGEFKLFNSVSEAGRTLSRSFCPNCGTTVYWEAEFLPDSVGVAAGCFEDPGFPEPMASVWTRTKHAWVTFPSHWKTSVTQEIK